MFELRCYGTGTICFKFLLNDCNNELNSQIPKVKQRPNTTFEYADIETDDMALIKVGHTIPRYMK